MATNKYKCKVCGYIHEGATAPEKCPVCQAPASEFELIEGSEQKKKGINKNSNAYIMIYTTVIVVIVALLLSVTSPTRMRPAAMPCGKSKPCTNAQATRGMMEN